MVYEEILNVMVGMEIEKEKWKIRGERGGKSDLNWSEEKNLRMEA